MRRRLHGLIRDDGTTWTVDSSLFGMAVPESLVNPILSEEHENSSDFYSGNGRRPGKPVVRRTLGNLCRSPKAGGPHPSQPPLRLLHLPPPPKLRRPAAIRSIRSAPRVRNSPHPASAPSNRGLSSESRSASRRFRLEGTYVQGTDLRLKLELKVFPDSVRGGSRRLVPGSLRRHDPVGPAPDRQPDAGDTP